MQRNRRPAAREFLTCSRRVSRRARAAHAGKARWERTRAPDLTETGAAAWRGITPAILLAGFPRHRLSMLPPTRRCSSIASSPASQSIRCSEGSASRGHREGSGRATSSTLTVSGKRNESRASDRGQKLLPPAVITRYARKSLSEIVFCKFGQRAVSDPRSGVNSVPQRRTFASQWDSRTRPAKRQHHRCIGCEKRPCWICLVFGLRVSSVKTLRRSWVWPTFRPVTRLPIPCGDGSARAFAPCVDAGGQQQRYRHWIKDGDKRQSDEPDRSLKIRGG